MDSHKNHNFCCPFLYMLNMKYGPKEPSTFDHFWYNYQTNSLKTCYIWSFLVQLPNQFLKNFYKQKFFIIFSLFLAKSVGYTGEFVTQTLQKTQKKKHNHHDSHILHIKFSPNPLSSCGEEDFERFLRYMGIAAILVMWSIPEWTNFHSPIPWRPHMKFG